MSELFLLVTIASANPKADAKAQQEQASTAFKLGRFEEALSGYARAYELFPAPGLLYNIGQCHRQLGHHERAVFFFQGYLREKPDSPMRAQVERLIDEERALSVPASAPVLQPRVILVQASTQPASMAVTAPPVSSAPRWWVWVIVAGGVAAVAGTVTAIALASDALPSGSLGTLDRRD